MRPRTLKILIAVLALLVIVAIFPSISGRLPIKKTSETETDLGLKPGVFDSTTKFTIARAGQPALTFEKQNGAWQVNKSYEASSEDVASFLKAFSQGVIAGVASRNPANKATFGLDDASVINLTLTAPEPARTYLIGSKSSGADALYLSKPGDNTVYALGQTSALTYLTRSVNDWRNHQILAIKTAEFGSAEITYPRRAAVTLTKKADGKLELTKLGRKSDLDPAAADRFLNALADLRALDFATNENAAAFERLKASAIILRFKKSDNSPLGELSLVQSPQKQWLAKSTTRPDVLILSDYTAESLLVDQ